MPLRPGDEQTLGLQSFLQDYQTFETHLVTLARLAFRAVCTALQAAPDLESCEEVLGETIYNDSVYHKEMAGRKQYLAPGKYQAHAEMLARYVLHQHWGDISRMPCP